MVNRNYFSFFEILTTIGFPNCFSRISIIFLTVCLVSNLLTITQGFNKSVCASPKYLEKSGKLGILVNNCQKGKELILSGDPAATNNLLKASL